MYPALIKNKNGKIIDCFNFDDYNEYQDFINTTDSYFIQLELKVEERILHLDVS